MRDDNQPQDPDNRGDQLARLAEMLRLEVKPEDLAALADQLRTLEELEKSALQDVSPILKMDAGWHD